jgi:hypothetical protein
MTLPVVSACISVTMLGEVQRVVVLAQRCDERPLMQDMVRGNPAKLERRGCLETFGNGKRVAVLPDLRCRTASLLSVSLVYRPRLRNMRGAMQRLDSPVRPDAAATL